MLGKFTGGICHDAARHYETLVSSKEIVKGWKHGGIIVHKRVIY